MYIKTTDDTDVYCPASASPLLEGKDNHILRYTRRTQLSMPAHLKLLICISHDVNMHWHRSLFIRLMVTFAFFLNSANAQGWPPFSQVLRWQHSSTSTAQNGRLEEAISEKWFSKKHSVPCRPPRIYTCTISGTKVSHEFLYHERI